MAMVAHAYSLLDAYIYGFALTKMNLPFEDTSDIVELSETMLAPFAPGEYQNLADFITDHAMKPGYDFANEFEQALMSSSTASNGCASGLTTLRTVDIRLGPRLAMPMDAVRFAGEIRYWKPERAGGLAVVDVPLADIQITGIGRG